MPMTKKTTLPIQSGTASIVMLAISVFDLTMVSLPAAVAHTDCSSANGTCQAQRNVWIIEDEPLTILRGHKDVVWSATFSPDGKFVVTGSEDRTAKLWDVTAGVEIVTLRGHYGGLHSVAFSPDGKLVVTASEDGTAKLWDASTGAEIADLRGHSGAVGSAAFSPDGKRVVTASGGTSSIWDIATGAEIVVMPGGGRTAAFSVDGTRVVTDLSPGHVTKSRP